MTTKNQDNHTLGVKVVLGDYIRRFRIPSTITLQGFWNLLQAKYASEKLDGLAIQYKDMDNDWIYCAVEDEWEEALLLNTSQMHITLVPARKPVLPQQQDQQIKTPVVANLSQESLLQPQQQPLPVVIAPTTTVATTTTTTASPVLASPWSSHLTKLQGILVLGLTSF